LRISLTDIRETKLSTMPTQGPSLRLSRPWPEDGICPEGSAFLPVARRGAPRDDPRLLGRLHRAVQEPTRVGPAGVSTRDFADIRRAVASTFPFRRPCGATGFRQDAGRSGERDPVGEGAAGRRGDGAGGRPARRSREVDKVTKKCGEVRPNPEDLGKYARRR